DRLERDRAGQPRGRGPRRAAARRAAGRAGLAAPVDRHCRRAREDDDRGHDRVLPRGAGLRPRVPDRRRDPAARRKRAGRRGLAGVPREAAEAVLPEFRGAGRRFERRGEAGGVQVFDDYGHHPSEIAATLETARSEVGPGRVLVVFQPHLFSRTRHVAAELAASLAAADAVAVTDVYAAREEPVPGVDGKLVVDELVSRRPGMAVAWTPALEDAARFLSRRARPGDLVITIG